MDGANTVDNKAAKITFSWRPILYVAISASADLHYGRVGMEKFTMPVRRLIPLNTR